MKEIHSFDVFDTCVTRIFAEPPDLFQALAVRMLRGAYPDFTREDIVDVATLRRGAERRARVALKNESTRREDIELAAIYEQADGLRRWNIDPERMRESEIELELESVRPVVPMLRRVQASRDRGHEIVFISDMYLPAETIRAMLENTGFFSEGDSLYVSGEAGVAKRYGELFKKIRDERGYNIKNWRHFGDHALADLAAPRRLGIRAEHFVDAILNEREARLLTEARGPDDIAVRSLLAGTARCTRVAQENEASLRRNLAEIAGTVSGPLLIAFTAWALMQAARRGIDTLYFVSRDGQILHRLAEVLSEYMPEGTVPRLRYLHGSRQAWFAAAGDESLDFLMIPGHSRAPVHVLRKLNIEYGEFAELAGNEFGDGQDDLNEESRRRFLEKLREPKIAELIRARGEEAFEGAAAYMRNQGLMEDGSWALVDIGWTLKSQRALSRILGRLGRQEPVGAFYLGVTADRLRDGSFGWYRSFFMHRGAAHGRPTREDAVFEHISLIEQIFTMADHGSVLGYRLDENTGEAEPLFKNSPPDPARSEFVQTQQEILLTLAREYGRAGLFQRENIEGTVRIMREVAMDALDEMARRPKAEHVRALTGIQVGDDQNESRQCALARPLGLGDVLGRIRGSVRGSHGDPFERRYIWFEGSLALSGGGIRAVFRGLDRVRLMLRENRIARALFRRG